MTAADDPVVTALTDAEDALLRLDVAISDGPRRLGVVGGRRVGEPEAEVPDMLLATIYDERRTWEIACEQVDDTLDHVHVRTLSQFLA